MRGLTFPLVALLLISAVFFNGCDKRITEIVSKAFIAEDEGSEADKLLTKEKLETSEDEDKELIYVLILDHDNPQLRKYELKNGQETTINIVKNKDFVFSLPGSKNSTFQWKIQNEIDESFIRLQKTEWMKIPVLPKGIKEKIFTSKTFVLASKV
jgi:hypothetical protein